MKKYNRFIQFIRNIVYGYSTPCCIGIDINHDNIKFVELCQNSMVIANYSIASNETSIVEKKSLLIENIANIINYEWNNFTKKYDHAAIKIAHSEIIIKELIIPSEISEFDINNYLHNLLIQELGIENIDFDYNIIKSDEIQQLVSVVIAKKDQIEDYYALMDLAGVKVAAIEVDIFALEHLFSILLKKNYITNDVLIVDVERDYIKIYMINNYKIVYSDTLKVNYSTLIFENFTTIEQQNISKQIVVDITKLIRSMYSNLVLHNLLHSSNCFLYLMGTNSVMHGLSDEIINSGVIDNCWFIDELFPPQPIVKSRAEFMQLITATALATWGHDFA